jgi:glutaredoxin-like protein
MTIFNEETRKQLTDLLGELKNKVNILFFGSETNCPTCGDTFRFMEAFSQLNDQIALQYCDLEMEATHPAALKIDKVPAIVLLDGLNHDYGIRFYGIPAGYEIHSLISAVREISGIPGEMPDEIIERIHSLDIPVHIKVFVTPTCSQCPGAAITAHRIAVHNEYITAEVIEANTFSELAQNYEVRSVPKVIINEKHAFTGAQPVTRYLEIIEKFMQSNTNSR